MCFSRNSWSQTDYVNERKLYILKTDILSPAVYGIIYHYLGLGLSFESQLNKRLAFQINTFVLSQKNVGDIDDSKKSNSYDLIPELKYYFKNKNLLGLYSGLYLRTRYHLYKSVTHFNPNRHFEFEEYMIGAGPILGYQIKIKKVCIDFLIGGGTLKSLKTVILRNDENRGVYQGYYPDYRISLNVGYQF